MKTKNHWYNRPNLAGERCKNINDTINMRGWIEQNHNKKCSERPPWHNDSQLGYIAEQSYKHLNTQQP